METLYFFKLPTAISAKATHVRVTQHLVDSDRINVHGEYGKLVGSDGWTPAEFMESFGVNIMGDDREDLDIAADEAGRPVGAPAHDLRTTDMVEYLEGDPEARQARIDARKPVPVVVEDEV